MPPYFFAQLTGAFAGVVLAHLMFDLPALAASTHARSGAGQLLSEAVATFGLLLTIIAVERHQAEAVPHAVALFIISAYWSTASTSFANPAVTLARAATNTFAGIRWTDAAGFIGAQVVGAALAVGLTGALWGRQGRTESEELSSMKG